MFSEDTYLNIARSGQNRWYHYILALFVILLIWFGFGSLPIGLALLAGLRADSPLYFTATLFSFVFMLLGLLAAQVWVHQRPFMTLINPTRRFDLRRFGQGFGLWLLLAAVLGLVEALLYPGRYLFTFDLSAWQRFLLPALILIPIQAGSEELLLRGYLLQGLGQKLRQPWLLSLLSGLIFALLHFGNPEMSVNAWLLQGYYLVFGALMALITLKDQRLELALGAHIANNLYTALLANYTVSALSTPAIWTIQTLDAAYGLLGLIVSGVLFYVFFFGGEALPQRE